MGLWFNLRVGGAGRVGFCAGAHRSGIAAASISTRINTAQESHMRSVKPIGSARAVVKMA
jgi:hypothetical protein